MAADTVQIQILRGEGGMCQKEKKIMYVEILNIPFTLQCYLPRMCKYNLQNSHVNQTTLQFGNLPLFALSINSCPVSFGTLVSNRYRQKQVVRMVHCYGMRP